MVVSERARQIVRENWFTEINDGDEKNKNRTATGSVRGASLHTKTKKCFAWSRSGFPVKNIVGRWVVGDETVSTRAGLHVARPPQSFQTARAFVADRPVTVTRAFFLFPVNGSRRAGAAAAAAGRTDGRRAPAQHPAVVCSPSTLAVRCSAGVVLFVVLFTVIRSGTPNGTGERYGYRSNMPSLSLTIAVAVATMVVTVPRCCSAAYCDEHLYPEDEKRRLSSTAGVRFTKELSANEYGPLGSFKTLHCCGERYLSLEWY